MRSDLLRVLVIHDSDLTPKTPAGILGTCDLDLCEITRGSGAKEVYIRQWETVLEVLQDVSQVEPRPDLVLVDSKFEKDETAPPLRSSPSGSSSEDPRGILYGVVLATHLFSGDQAPWGFALYSMDLASVAEDPYAQTFYGLLAATGEDAKLPSGRGAVFRNEMVDTPVGGRASDKWPEALSRYRQSLWGHLGYRLTPDYPTFASAAGAVRRFIKGEAETIPPDTVVCWKGSGASERCLLLSSLYADCREQPSGEWNEKLLKKEDVLSQLESVVARTWRKDMAGTVCENLSSWYGSENRWSNPPEASAKPWSRGEQGRWEKTVAFIVLRALNLAEIRHRTEKSLRYLDGPEGATELDAKNLAEFIGLGVKPTGFDRTMRRALGHVLDPAKNPDYSPVSVLSALKWESHPWPERWPPEVGHIVAQVMGGLTKNLGSKRVALHRDYWPRWIPRDEGHED